MKAAGDSAVQPADPQHGVLPRLVDGGPAEPLIAASGFRGDFVGWFAIVAKTGLYVAFVELVLDLIWVVVIRLNHRGVAPPRALKDLALVAAAVVIVAVEMNTRDFSPQWDLQQFWVAWRSSLVLARRHRSAKFRRRWQFRWSASLRLATGWKSLVS